MPRVLLAEDDGVIARAMMAHLRRAGMDVEWAEDGDRALKKIRFERPDVAVIDLMLPGEDGWRITRTLREEGITIPVIMRVRHVTQDDAHIFCTMEQIEDEIFACLDYVDLLYGIFGVVPQPELSLRPDNKLGSDEDWDVAEAALRSALDRRGIDYVTSPGEGAFYGPKIDLHMAPV